MRRILNTTTALVASLSLAVPAPLRAQESSGEVLLCLDGNPPPCAPGQDPNNPEDVAAKAAAEAKAAEEAAAAEAARKAAEEAAAAEAAQKAAEEAAAAEAAQKAAEEAAAAEAAQKAAEDQATTDAKALEEALKAEEAAKAEEAVETAPASPEPSVQGEPETAGSAESLPAEGQPGSGSVTEDDLAQALAAEGGAAAPEEVPDLPVQPDASTGAPPVAAALAAGPAKGDDPAAPLAEAAGVAVAEEVVTEKDVRASSEDFATKVTETAPAAAKKKKERLSDLEKALLVGLGAVAIGAIISNNRRVELNSGDRVVVSRDDGSYQVIKDDDVLLRRPGDKVRTETFRDGSSRTIVTRPDGSRVVTIRDAEYRVIRRSVIDANGREYLLIDDSQAYDPVVVGKLPRPARPVVVDATDERALREALARESDFGRRFSLAQIRDIAEVRFLVPAIDLDEITFETGSAAIRPDQARALAALGRVIQDYIARNPREMFLIEGHTDAVGRASYNLALSDRRAESVAKALTEYFDIPPENLVVQGYGEEFLKIDTQEAERANRRASVRRITSLLRTAG
ncbi:MAG: OmpA family protein [Rhodobacteraceae bacterium]|nr:OmpA family protein [Paracoccaceae bacterium]